MTTNNPVNSPLNGTTGTGNFVGSSSPTITTPVIGRIMDVNGNVMLDFSVLPSAVNYLLINNSGTNAALGISAIGTDTNIIFSLAGKGTGQCQIKGISSANNVSAGYVGEFISSIVTYASNTAISTATPTNITSISLTAGDWDVWGNVGFEETAVGFSSVAGGITLTSATLPAQELRSYNNIPAATGESSLSFKVPDLRVNIASTTTVYLVGQVSFASGSARMFGGIYARRRC